MKKGISLISLVITIVILLIILSTVVTSTVIITNNSKKTLFAKDLKAIEEAVVSEYNTSGVLPTVSGSDYTAQEIKGMLDDDQEISLEFVENADEGSNFYEVDLIKLGIKNSSRGTKKEGNIKDIYIVSDNLNVYYLSGLKVGGQTYFSLTYSLVKQTKVSKVPDQGIESADTVLANGINISKDKKTWTNEITLTLNIEKNEGDIIKYSIAGQTEISINIDTTNNIILNYANLTESERNAIITGLVENKKVVVRRYNSAGVEITNATIYIKNLDIESPSAGVTPPTLEDLSNENILTFSSMTDTGGSGIKELKYEFVTKLNSSNIDENAYNPQPTIDKVYLKNTGKISNNINKIVLPKHIKVIAVSWIDNAGNIGDIVSYGIAAGGLIKETKPPYITNGLVLLLDGINFRNSPQSPLWVNKIGDYNNATPYNFSYTTSSGSDGSNAVAFDGVNDYMKIPHSSSLTPQNITISVLVNAKNWEAPTATNLVIKRSAITSYFLFVMNGGGLHFDWSGLRWNTLYIPPVNKWVSITVTRDNTKRKLYIDGIFYSETTAVGPDTSGTADVYIGSDKGTSYFYNGKMRSVRIYNRALTDSEILQNYLSDMERL